MAETADLSAWVAWTYVFSATVILISGLATWAGLRSERRRRARNRVLVPAESLRALLTGDVDVLVELNSAQDVRTVEVHDVSGTSKTYERRYAVFIRAKDVAPAAHVAPAAIRLDAPR